ncbi:MAG: putative toxin-antitoxin system toxin component, PIN family [Selenomonadaceae bacterium]|nr:putative toxin-antitoxin system toxin component, PIN family [Selenomonadaceae bacterium]
MKIVIDTNVLISATFFGGMPRKVINLVIDETVSAYMNAEILAEYEKTSLKMKSKNKWRINQILFDKFLSEVKMVDSVTTVNICRDPDDNKFIACAVDAKAIYIVSGDKDLLTVKNYDEIEIVTAKEFYERYLLSQP